METVVFKKNHLNNSLGVLHSWLPVDNGLEGTTSNGNFRVTVYKDSLFRVQVSKSDTFESNLYSVVEQPKGSSFDVVECDTEIEVKGTQMTLKIIKSPVRFEFYTLEGKLINRDDPAFGVSWLGEQVNCYKELQEGERFLGLGEKTGPLDRRGKGYTNWNTDHFAYGEDSDPLYCSIPFYLGVHSELAYGIFFDNSHKSFFNFGASNNRFSSFGADMGEMDYYFFHNSGVSKIIEDYTWLTGRMELPPLWSLGFQQCRYSYYPESEVLGIAKTFRDKDIPADAIVLDIHHMEKYKIFTFDNQRFQNPKSMIENLEKLGFKVVVILDPGIKIEPGYEAYHKGSEEQIFIKYPDGTDYSGQVWPGWCHFPDFTNEKAREWWKKQLQFYVDHGVEGFWNDMNEIATWGQFLPELMELEFEGKKGSMRQGRNLYGLLMAKSTYEGATKHLNKRPFNLSRSGFSGIQRYSAVWTGDNVASDNHMLAGIRLVNSLGLSGVAFAGYDVGGFVGNANEQLYARWIQLGAFSPFFRGHSMINSRDSEPWAFGEEVEEIARNYIKLRYKLMPYLYSLFFEASENGMPVTRSLAIEYTHEPLVYSKDFQNQYFFGPNIMVAPAESSHQFTKIFLPEDGYYDLFTDERYSKGSRVVESPLYKLPLFVKPSSILTIDSGCKVNTSSDSKQLDIHVYYGEEQSMFSMYDDDGQTFNYKSEEYCKRIIAFNPQEKEIFIDSCSGNFESRYTSARVYLHGFPKSESYNLNGESIPLNYDSFRFVEPISNFDPLGETDQLPLEIENLAFITIDLSAHNKICW